MIGDLASQHGMLGETFSATGSGAGPEAERLTEQQITFFQEHGYVKGGRVLNPAQVQVLRDELDSFYDDGHPGNELWYEYNSNEAETSGQVLFHALGAWRIGAGFHDLLWHYPWLIRASQLLDAPVRFWHDQLFCKPARQGGVVSWHQDYSYWQRTVPLAHLTCWIALDDSTRENGCIHYLPGSHCWNLLPITGLAGDMEAIAEVLTPNQLELFDKPEAVELSAGECVFHHPLTVHGSFENRSPHPRRATVVNVFADGVKSASDEELLKGVPPIPSGKKMAGQFFPLLYDPEA